MKCVIIVYTFTCFFFILGILVPTGMKETETERETERGRGTERGIDGPLEGGHDLPTSGTGGTQGQTRLHTNHHGDGGLHLPQLKRGRGKRRAFPYLGTKPALVNYFFHNFNTFSALS